MQSTAIIDAVKGVTKDWAKQRKREEREQNAFYRRQDALTSFRRVTIRDAAWEVMEEAYLKASSGNTLPAHARQIMYAARGGIQEQTGRTLDDQYFTQTLLPDYLREHPAETADWDVVFDARGHFEEPHTNKNVPLGTLQVRHYLGEMTHHAVGDIELEVKGGQSYPTCGPEHRFGAVLFIEKEGFMPLFRKVRLADRYDLAIMSTKGLSVTASRHLVDQLCGTYKIPLLVLHDFDKAGFSILGTLRRDTRRYEFEHNVEVIDLGIRLEDIQKYSLPSEKVSYGKTDPTWNLGENGATKAEIDYLCDHRDWHRCSGQRVELNAFASRDLVDWIEAKLRKHKIVKLVPGDETLALAYRRSLEARKLNARLEEIAEDVGQEIEKAKVPRGLSTKIKRDLKAHPSDSWDDAVARIAAKADDP